MLNKCIFIGRLTMDPELRYTQGGAAVCSFSLAVERSFTNAQGEKEVDFIEHVAWKKLAETVANNLEKGRLVATECRIEQQRWEKDSKKYSKLVAVAESVRFLDWPKKEGQQTDFPGTEVDIPPENLPF